jgi:hypothetical protein
LFCNSSVVPDLLFNTGRSNHGKLQECINRLHCRQFWEYPLWKLGLTRSCNEHVGLGHAHKT